MCRNRDQRLVADLHAEDGLVLVEEQVPRLEDATLAADEEQRAPTATPRAGQGFVVVRSRPDDGRLLALLRPHLGLPVAHGQEDLDERGIALQGVDGSVVALGLRKELGCLVCPR